MRFFSNRQDDATNSQVPNTRIETGWGVVTVVNGTIQYSKVITFQTPFTNKPIVLVSPGGDNTTGSGYGTGSNVISAQWWSKAINITNSTFVAQLNAPSGSVTIGGALWYQWIAIGV
jgi:hypothetical protein